MEFQELPVGKGLYKDILISATDNGSKFTGQDSGIAPRNYYVRIVLCSVTAYASLPFLDVLNFIDQNDIVLRPVEIEINEGIQVGVCLNVVKVFFLLVDVDDIV